MQYSKNLEGNLDDLFQKLAGLEGLTERTGARRKPQMKIWLEDVESITQKAHETQKELEELKKGQGRHVKEERQKLNKKVIGYLKDVNDLEEEGKVKAESIEGLLKELQRDKLERFTPADLVEFTENYTTSIGEGAYGRVYKGHFRDNFPLAVKVLDDKGVTLVEETFMAEVRTMGRTSHRNLVKLYGFCFTIEKKALVYEYMEKGSLDNYLYNQNFERIEWGKLYEIAIETAWGLFYLHEGLKARVIHRDVKPANVLLDSDNCPKLTDFGVAKLMNRDLSHVTWTRERGTPGFAAPEMWTPGSRVTYKCDVYSFGMMLFEILGRRRNNNGKKWFPHQVEAMIKSSQLDQLLDDCGIKEKDDREKAKILCTVALQCIEKEAESRPTMSSVMNMLKGENEVHIPPQLSPPQPTPDVIQELERNPLLPPSIRVDKSPQTSLKAEKEVPVTTVAEAMLEEYTYECPPGGENCGSEEIERIQEQGKMQTLPHGIQLLASTSKLEAFSEDDMKEQVPNSQSHTAMSMLNRYKRKCPPGGENSVVIYTTTNKFAKALVLKNCDYVRSILESYRVQISERDCYIDANYTVELEELMRRQKKLPRVFVRGRYIGGIRETRRLHEMGEMSTLLHEI